MKTFSRHCAVVSVNAPMIHLLSRSIDHWIAPWKIKFDHTQPKGTKGHIGSLINHSEVYRSIR